MERRPNLYRGILLILLVLCVFQFTNNANVKAEPVQFICGDIDGDGTNPNVADLTYLVVFLFAEGTPPPITEAADLDGVTGINVADVTYLVAYLFMGGSDLVCPPYQELYHEDISGGCVGDSTAVKDGGYNHEEITGECVGYRSGEEDSSYMFVELIGNDLHVYHINAYYQCCLEYYITYDIEGYNITAFESDTGEQCDCLCYFNLESILYDLMIFEPCEYVVTLIGIYGDTVGIDTLVISDSDYVSIEVIGNDLHINHMNAYYNCCLEYYVQYDINGSYITALESDTGMPCWCICYFNVKSVLYDLENGEYIVTVIGIEGDTLGVDTVTVDYEYNLIGYGQVGCLEKMPTGDPPNIAYSYSGDTLTMEHFDAFFNCGADILVVFERAGDTLRFYEINTSDEYAYCMCYFEVSATVNNIEPGEYIAEVYAYEPIEPPMQLIDRRVIQLEN